MQVMRRIPYWGVLALLIYMPFHIFLAQSLSLATGGLEVWKIAKDVLLGVLALFAICLIWQQKASNKLFNWLAGLAAIYFGMHLLLWLANPDIYQKSAVLGIIYNTRLFGFLLLGYAAVLLTVKKFAFSSVIKIVLAVSTVVALLGVLQYFLPKDLLTHLGYGLERGTRPAFFIDDNPALPRIMSTLREPNALGAYLLLPLAALSLFFLQAKDRFKKLALGGAWLLHCLAIFLTFSRSAWLGAALVVALVVWWRYGKNVGSLIKRWWPLLAACLVLVIVVGFTQRSNSFIDSYITHATPEDVEDLDSNDYHWLLVRQGIEGVAERPLGHGPGTAGIVSIQDPHGGLLTENYYVQIAYEVGVVGLALFIIASVMVYLRLYRRHDDIGAILLASFWAYVLINMLLHTWSNETVAAQWWLLAGMALASSSKHVGSSAAKKHANV